MRQWMFGLAAAAVVAPAVRADDKPAQDAKAVAVVKKAVEAHGGAEALDKYKAAELKMKGDVSIMGLEVGFTGDLVYQLPDKFKMDMNADVMGQKIAIRQVMNGKNVKMTVNGAAVPLPDQVKEAMAATVTAQEIGQITPLLDPAKGYTLKHGGQADVGEKKADVVVVSGKRVNDKEWKLFFDAKTGLLVKTERKGISGDGMKEVDEETTFEDYKKVQGMMTPHKSVTKHDGQQYIAMTFTEVKYLEKADPKAFGTDD